MTLLSICTDVAEEVGVPAPTSIVGNSGVTEGKLLRHANAVGTRLMRKVCWQALRKEQTFTSLGQEAQTSIIPSDFDHFVPETFWDRDNSRLLTGPIDAVEWQGLKANSYAESYLTRFIHRGDDVLIIPVPDAGNTFAFEYVNKNWALSSGSTPQAKFLADTDTSVIDAELLTLGVIYRYLDSEGLPAANAYGAFEDMFNTLVDNDQPSGGVVMAADIFGQFSRRHSGAPQGNSTVDTVY